MISASHARARAMAAERAAYRAVLRVCRDIDRSPVDRVLLLGRPPRWYNPFLGSTVRVRASFPLAQDALSAAAGGCTEFAQPSTPLVREARKHFELTQLVGLGYVDESCELRRRLEAGVALGTDLRALLQAGVSQAEADLQAAAKAEAAEGVHRLPPGSAEAEPRVADMLLAHPLSCVMQPVFDRSAILLFDANDAGVQGVVLNRPLHRSLREILMNWPVSEDREWAETLGPLLDVPIYGGGPVIGRSLHTAISWLSTRELTDAQQVAPTLWFGGDPTAASKLALEDPASIRVFIGYSGWAVPQLRNEIERGVWVHARSSAADFGSSLLAKTDDALACWRSLLAGAGMRRLAAFPRGPEIDQRLQEAVSAHYDTNMKESDALAEREAERGVV